MGLNLEETIKNILNDFPSLEAWQSGDGTGIFIKGTTSFNEGENLVGTYSYESFNRGDISEQEIREDCEEFYKEGGR